MFFFENGYFPFETRVQFSSSKGVGGFHVSLTDTRAELSSGVDWDPGNTLELYHEMVADEQPPTSSGIINLSSPSSLLLYRFNSTNLRSCGCA